MNDKRETIPIYPIYPINPINPIYPINPANKNIKGFTLAEVIIVMIIIGLLMTLGTRVYYDEKDRFEYNYSLTKIISLINSAKNLAITSTPVYINGKSIIPTNGYGVYINLKPSNNEPNFTVFASLGDDDGNDSTFNKKYDKQILTTSDNIKDHIIETYRLPKQIEFQYFIFDTDGKSPTEKWNVVTKQPSSTEAVIFFRPPLAESFIGDNNNGSLETLGMRFYNSNAIQESPKKCQTISVNRIKNFPEINYSNCSEFSI